MDTSQEYLGYVKVSSFNYDRNMYVKLYLWLYKSVLKDYKFRKKIIGFLFEDDTLVKMKVRTAIINLIFWKPYCDFGKMLTCDKIFDTSCKDSSTMDACIGNRFDLIIEEFKPLVKVEELCKCIRYMIESLSSISVNFCVKQGNTITMRDIIDLADRNPQFNEILHTHYDEDNLPPINVIEKDINDKNKIMAEIIKNDKKSTLRPFIKAGGNVNMGQMSQCLVSVGPRSDIFGNISPVIVNTNFVMGLRNVSDYYLESFSQRKALIANKYQMCDSGYTSRQIDLLSVDSCLADVDDCGTENTLEFFIPNEAALNMLEFKYIVTGRDSNGKQILHEINPKTDKYLIGTTVQLRSHTKCALTNGSYCKTCYGGLSYVTLGYHTNLLASHAMTEPVSQKVLSSKHLNKTKTKVVEWNDMFKKFFITESEGLYIKPEYCDKNVEIAFYSEDIEEYVNMLNDTNTEEDEEENAESNIMSEYITRFSIFVDGQQFDFDDIDVELYINSEFMQKIMKSDKTEDGMIYVNLANQLPESAIFDINIENIEISLFLKKVMNLLGVKSKTCYTTVEDLLQKLSNAIIDIEVNINFAHLESIVCNMVRDPKCIIQKPDFNTLNPEYEIVPTNQSITYSGSLTTSFSFERIVYQLKNVYTYLKNRKGVLDPFFK